MKKTTEGSASHQHGPNKEKKQKKTKYVGKVITDPLVIQKIKEKKEKDKDKEK